MPTFVINTVWGLALVGAGAFAGFKVGYAFAQREAAALMAMLAAGMRQPVTQPEPVEVEGEVQ